MPVVWIPAPMRPLTAGRATVAVPGVNVREVVEALDAIFPGFKARVVDGGSLRSGMAVAVGSHIARRGLDESVNPDSEVHFLPAIGGGHD